MTMNTLGNDALPDGHRATRGGPSEPFGFMRGLREEADRRSAEGEAVPWPNAVIANLQQRIADLTDEVETLVAANAALGQECQTAETLLMSFVDYEGLSPAGEGLALDLAAELRNVLAAQGAAGAPMLAELSALRRVRDAAVRLQRTDGDDLASLKADAAALDEALAAVPS